MPSHNRTDARATRCSVARQMFQEILRLSAIIHEGDAEAVVKEKKEKALAEHVARHPEDVGRTVEAAAQEPKKM